MAKPREPLLRKADFSSYLEGRAREMAPRDVEVLLLEADSARSRAAALSKRMGDQMALAMELLADHHSGEAPQIPFYTISLLAEAVYYFLDPNDVIPDWIPEIGKLDDALVLELAFELGADGIRRYCAWKGLDENAIYAPGAATAPAASETPARPPRRRAGKKPTAKKKPTSKARPSAAKKGGKARKGASQGKAPKSGQKRR